ncbi:hypothetical protein [Litorimonas sp.]
MMDLFIEIAAKIMLGLLCVSASMVFEDNGKVSFLFVAAITLAIIGVW